jgi:glyoxylase-like metal-dependent hydrolase (beta-lactamase superfamily II)
MPVKNAAAESLSIQPFTSSEAGAWSNSYLISGRSEAILYDVFQLHSEATRLAEMIKQSGKTLKTVFISHAHPDHFMGLDVIVEHFPQSRIVSTPNVVGDIRENGPWMFSLLQSKLGAEGPKRLVVPEALAELALHVEGNELNIVEFGEGESRHMACLYIPDLNALLSADMVYNNAHLYLQERHLESWLARLDELEAFTKGRVSTIYPGHGAPADLTIISRNRAYLHDFADAVKSGDAKTAEQQILAKYPEHHVRQFLTMFSLPVYFPPVSST